MIGEILSNRYELVREIGRGGMGVVYLAQDPLLEREVAIKLVLTSQLDSDGEMRILREAKVLAQMDHPSIVPVYDIGRKEGLVFFVMPFLKGGTLRDLIRERSLTYGDILLLGIQIAEALAYSHQRGVFHRDVKPENILIEREASGIRARIMDFGIARLASKANLTQTGSLVGTVHYMSPEQILGNPQDGRSDLYSLATVLFECLTGKPPFHGELHSVLYAIVSAPPPSLMERGLKVDPRLDEALRHCLQKEPDQRPRDARELAENLNELALESSMGARSRMQMASVREGDSPSSFRAQLPLVGRARELREIEDQIERFQNRGCQILLLGGEDGIGKTRLLQEAHRILHQKGILTLQIRLVDEDSDFPYQGFQELIQELLRKANVYIRADSTFQSMAQELVAYFPALADLGEIQAHLHLQPEGSLSRSEDPIRLKELIARLLEWIGTKRPLALLMEDLHQASSSLEILSYLLQRLSAIPLLFMGSYRSTEISETHALTRFLERQAGRPHFVDLQLGPLRATEFQALLAALFPQGQFSEALRIRLYEFTRGNPFYTREMVQALMDSGDLRLETGGKLALVREDALDHLLPGSLLSGIQKRLRLLPESQRRVLAVGALLGHKFSLWELELGLLDPDTLTPSFVSTGEVLGARDAAQDVRAALDALLRQGIIEEESGRSGGILVFANELLRVAVLKSLPDSVRIQLHRTFALNLESRVRGRNEAFLPKLVHHFHEGQLPEQVNIYGQRLMSIFLDTRQSAEAIKVAKILQETAESLDSTLEVARIQALIAEAYRQMGHLDEALDAMEVVLESLIPSEAPEAYLEHCLTAAEVSWEALDLERAERFLKQGLLLSRQLGMEELLRRFLALAAATANFQGDHDQLQSFLQEKNDLQLPATTQAIHKGGCLKVALPLEVRRIDPVYIGFEQEAEVSGNIFETLISSDAEGNPVPCLCESWEALEEEDTYRFHLRTGVKYSDGRVLKALDVKKAFLRFLSNHKTFLPLALGSILGAEEVALGETHELEGFQLLSDLDFQIRLTRFLPYYPSLLRDPRTAISLLEGDRLLGTGPFQWTAQDQQQITLTPNLHYWNTNPPALERLDFFCGLDPESMIQGLLKGQLDIIQNLSPNDQEKLLNQAQDPLAVHSTFKRNLHFLLFNTSTRAGRNPAFRKALAGVLDDEALLQSALGSRVHNTTRIFPSGILGTLPEIERPTLAISEALDLLNTSGLPLPISVKIAIHPILQGRYAQLTKRFVENLFAIGVDLSFATSSQDHEEGRSVDLYLGRWAANFDDPENFTHALFHSRDGFFRNYFSSQEMDRLMEQARRERQPDLRKRAYLEIEKHLLEQHVLLPLFNDLGSRILHPAVQGLEFQRVPPSIAYHRLWKLPNREALPHETPVLRLATEAFIPLLDPMALLKEPFDSIGRSVFQSLTRMGPHAVEAWLAESWASLENGRVYRFVLKEHLTFQDGTPLSPEDIHASLVYFLRHRPCNDLPILGASAVKAGESQALLGFISEDPLVFELRMEQPCAALPAILTAIPILSRLQVGLEFQKPPMWLGTGPYRIQEFDPDLRLELQASGEATIPRIHLYLGIQEEDQVGGYQGGFFSLLARATNGRSRHLKTLGVAPPQLVETFPDQSIFLVVSPSITKLQERLSALKLFGGLNLGCLLASERPCSKAATQLMPQWPDYSLPEALESVMGNEDLPDTQEGSLRVALSETLDASLSHDIQNLWKELNLPVECFSFDPAGPPPAADLLLLNWKSPYPDPDGFFRSLLHQRGGWLGAWLGSQEIDDLLDLALQEMDHFHRTLLYGELEHHLQEQAWVLPILHQGQVFALGSGIQIVDVLNPLDAWLDLNKLGIMSENLAS